MILKYHVFWRQFYIKNGPLYGQKWAEKVCSTAWKSKGYIMGKTATLINAVTFSSIKDVGFTRSVNWCQIWQQETHFKTSICKPVGKFDRLCNMSMFLTAWSGYICYFRVAKYLQSGAGTDSLLYLQRIWHATGQHHSSTTIIPLHDISRLVHILFLPPTLFFWHWKNKRNSNRDILHNTGGKKTNKGL